MKSFKRILCLALAVVMTLFYCITAFGAEVDSNRNVAVTRDNVSVSNKEAEAAYMEFLNAVSFIDTDETWSEGFAACLNQYGENSINRNTYSQWYANYVQDGSVEEYFAMTSFEQFLWTETYTRLAYAAGGSGDYNKYFGDEKSFEMYIKDIATGVMNGNNNDVVIAAYEKLMDWQYAYITENGIPFNFITNRTYVEEVAAPPAQEDPKLSEDEEIKEVIDELEKDGEIDEEKGIWDDTMDSLANNALTIIVLIILVIAVLIVGYIRKRKNIDGDK